MNDAHEATLPRVPSMCSSDGLRNGYPSFVVEGTIQDVNRDSFDGVQCGDPVRFGGAVLTVASAADSWTVVLHFDIEVEVGDAVSLSYELDSEGSFASRETFALRGVDGRLLYWSGSWWQAPNPHLPAELTRLSPGASGELCEDVHGCENEFRGYDLELDGVQGGIRFGEPGVIGAFNVVGILRSFADCPGEGISKSQQLEITRRRAM